jgi:hypothetical protein
MPNSASPSIAGAPGAAPLDAADAADFDQKSRAAARGSTDRAPRPQLDPSSGADFGFVLGLSLTQIIDYGVREFAANDYGFIAKSIARPDPAAAGLSSPWHLCPAPTPGRSSPAW